MNKTKPESTKLSTSDVIAKLCCLGRPPLTQAEAHELAWEYSYLSCSWWHAYRCANDAEEHWHIARITGPQRAIREFEN